MGKAVLILIWIAGVILAEGFWWTALALFIPVYAYYLVVMKIMVHLGWLA